ncbi:MAG: hypothetical protein H6868_05930 [Rhodospirillales bacterium]|nr:hypothetical protein [Rhodospirillales bacterium]
MDDTPKKKVTRIPASRELQSRVGTGEVDKKAIGQAQDVIENNKVDFEPIAKPYLAELRRIVQDARDGKLSGPELADLITQPIMNLKANAGTFNYPVISSLTGTVLMFMDTVKKVDNDIIDIADNLQKAVMVVIHQKMSGDGGPAGQALAKEFASVCQRYIDRKK